MWPGLSKLCRRSPLDDAPQVRPAKATGTHDTAAYQEAKSPKNTENTTDRLYQKGDPNLRKSKLDEQKSETYETRPLVPMLVPTHGNRSTNQTIADKSDRPTTTHRDAASATNDNSRDRPSTRVAKRVKGFEPSTSSLGNFFQRFCKDRLDILM